MKVALYCRVSLDESADSRRFQDIDNQKAPLIDWATRMGWEITAIYQDHESGANPARHDFRAMLEAARQRKFDAVLVWKSDRFSREGILNTIAYIQTLKKYGVSLKSFTESWLDTSQDNPASELILSVMAWCAAEERRKISERTKAGIARRRQIGAWKGGRPRKNLPPILDVCRPGPEGFTCKLCDPTGIVKTFKNEEEYKKKWRGHARWALHTTKKGGGVSATPTTPTPEKGR